LLAFFVKEGFVTKGVSRGVVLLEAGIYGGASCELEENVNFVKRQSQPRAP
jgi:hypothetical protein